MADIRVHIEKLAIGGNGVGRVNGKVCFVPFSCPGDELIVRVLSEKRSYMTAGIDRILIPGDSRVDAPCGLAGICGGCDWQHVNYTRQLSEKRQIFADAFWRGARAPSELIGEVVPSVRQYGYRSRVQFKLYHATTGLQIGFYRQGTHFVEDVGKGCPIAAPVINRVLGKLRKILAQHPEPAKIPQINIDEAESGLVVVVNYIGRDPDRTASFFEERSADLEGVTGLFLQCGRKTTLRRVFGEGTLEYSLPGHAATEPACVLGYRPGGFAQVNRLQNVELLRLVRRFAECSGKDHILDLYCGNGNFSLPLSPNVASVTGIEEYGDSIAAARENARRNGISNAEFICSGAEAGIRELADAGRYFDTVILDPPRVGAAEAVGDILRLRPKRIIYISCDPSTLARDCGALAKGGYAVVASIPVDMFPQTCHLESVTLLKAKERRAV